MQKGSFKTAITLTSLCIAMVSGAYGEDAQPPSQTLSAATVNPEQSWSKAWDESDHNFQCGNENTGTQRLIMIGRKHNGDENDGTNYKCADVVQFETLKTLVDQEELENDPEAGRYFTCPKNKVLTDALELATKTRMKNLSVPPC